MKEKSFRRKNFLFDYMNNCDQYQTKWIKFLSSMKHHRNFFFNSNSQSFRANSIALLLPSGAEACIQTRYILSIFNQNTVSLWVNTCRSKVVCVSGTHPVPMWMVDPHNHRQVCYIFSFVTSYMFQYSHFNQNDFSRSCHAQNLIEILCNCCSSH